MTTLPTNKPSDERPIAIKISNVKKMYKLGQIGGGTLQRDLQSWWARIRHKEDPNTKIGSTRLTGETFMALNGIDLTIFQGEAIGIIGHNGAGKSTLLKLLSRVTAPTEGDIDIYGRITSMLEVGTGFNGEMTGRENIYMNGAILGMTKAEIDAQMEEIIDFSEVHDFIDTPVKRYSSGMYVKLAFSVAAHLDSEIMIMDEVLAVGDMAFQKKCLDKMREAANKQGRTVLYVSHNMSTIRQLCGRCIVLDMGKVVYEGDVEKAISIYLGEDKEDSHIRQFTSFIRDDSLPNDNTIRFLRSEYLFDKNNKELLSIKVSWKNLHAVGDVYLRVEFSCNGIGVATAFSSTPIQLRDKEAIITVNTSRLSSSKYKVMLVAFHLKNNYSFEYDFVELPIYNKKASNNEIVNWNHDIWGHMRLDDFTITYS